jgi:hypothetical protein
MAQMIKPDNRLKNALSKTKGMSRNQAVKNATERLELVRGISLAEVDRTLEEEIVVLSREIRDVDDPRVADLYTAANRIVAVAGIFDLTELGEASYSLCELITRLTDGGVWRREMVMVHSEAMQLLRHPSAQPEEARQALKTGLRKVLAQVAPVEPDPPPVPPTPPAAEAAAKE